MLPDAGNDRRPRCSSCRVALGALLGTVSSAESGPTIDAQRPDEFAIVFTLGYAGDLLPQEPDAYDSVMQKVADGSFNTVMASHETWRLPIMEQRGLKLMVDLLDSRHHVYHNLEGAEALCTSLRDEPTVWGYHLFSDTTASIVPGRQRDINNVRAWDPTHPTFVGVKHHVGGSIREMTSPDVIGYYDYHWVRDRDIHFPNLAFFSRYADDHDAPLYRWVWVENGKAGIGNPNRGRYTVFTSMAFGLKGVMWFIGQQMMNTGNWQWNQFGLDTIGINEEVAKLGPELMPLERRVTHSTHTTRTANDRDKERSVPGGLIAIPEDYWYTVDGGEAVIGEFEHHDGRDRLLVANHNAYQPQPMVLTFEAEVTGVELFDRETVDWRRLEMNTGVVTWTLDSGFGDLLRIEREPAPTKTPPATLVPTATATPEATEPPAGVALFLPIGWRQ